MELLNCKSTVSTRQNTELLYCKHQHAYLKVIQWTSFNMMIIKPNFGICTGIITSILSDILIIISPDKAYMFVLVLLIKYIHTDN